METEFHHQKQMESDHLCWNCRRKNPTLCCASCPRSFHNTPSCSHSKKMTEEEMKLWRCPECIEIDKGKEQLQAKKISATSLQKLLKCVFKLLQADEEVEAAFMDITFPSANGKVVNPLNLSTIRTKIEDGAYSCCEELGSDVKWIAHNTKIHFKGEVLKATRILLQIIKEELYSIRICYECHLRANEGGAEWFVAACEQPHLLVWAKQKTFPFWPAKLMLVNSVQNTVDVHYFGAGHLTAVLTPKDCFMYSQESPKLVFGRYKDEIRAAQKEAERYIQNITATFGSFNFSPTNKLLHAGMIERHLYEMIPKAWEKLGKTVVPPPIPVPAPASVRARRQSVPARFVTTSTAPVVTAGRIMTRRMSMIAEMNRPNETNREINFEPPSGAVRRELVRLDAPNSRNQPNSKFSALNKLQKKTTAPNDDQNSSASPVKKQKFGDLGTSIDDSEPSGLQSPLSSMTNENSTLIDGSATSSNDFSTETSSETIPSPFKVPDVPKPKRIAKNSSNRKLKPQIITKQHAVNKSKANDDDDPFCKRKLFSDAIRSSTGAKNTSSRSEEDEGYRKDSHSAQVKPRMLNFEDQQIPPASKTTLSPEMTAMHKAIIEKDAQSLTKCIQTSLTQTLFGFLDRFKSTDQSQKDSSSNDDTTIGA